jgi:hypothetical protein
MPLRQAFRPVSGSLLIVPIQQAPRFFAKAEPFSQLNNTWGSGGSQSRMWDGMASGVPMGIRRRAYPSPLTGPSPPCSHASCKASTHSCSKRLRTTVLQADDSPCNSNSVITQGGRDMGCCVSLAMIPRERCLHNEATYMLVPNLEPPATLYHADTTPAPPSCCRQ